ncbi:RNA-binding protein 34 [Punica granatum]|nr:RNA-binding protein 34 [Punica granatum]OWM64158.1 hypothetical protein CDL15_Pgr018729 [Punica granatum]
MGKKKEKKPEASSSVGPNDDDSAQPDVFNTLFGDVAGQSSFSSIFSDNNPFKRKHSELKRGFGTSDRPAESPENGDSAKVEVKKRKASRDSIDEATKDPLELAKSKKEKQKDASSAASVSKSVLKKLKERDAQADSDSNASLEVPRAKASEPGLASDAVVSNDKQEARDVGVDGEKSNEEDREKRKKRKRDELEKAYEIMKYGPSGKEADNGEGEKVVGKKRKKADNPADMLVAKEEGFDDENKLLRTVFVGNLPLKMKKKALLKEFSKFGEVESVRIRSVPILDTKVPRKGAVITKKINDAVDSIHAYVVFKSEESAKASLAHNMAVVGGNHIRVDRACPPRKKLKGEDTPVYDNKRTVFVGNLPFDVKDEEVYQLFACINNLESSIEAVRVVRDPHTSLGKGIAYVLFKTREAANLVVKKRSLKLRDRQLRLFHARPDSTPSKRSNPSPAEGANSPSKKMALDSNTPNKPKKPSKADLSYEGLHGKKASSALKKPWKKSIGVVKSGKGSAKRGSAGKERTSKRPAVAARKAKANAMNEIGSPLNRTDKKRKLESRTPDSFQQKRKVKKFK